MYFPLNIIIFLDIADNNIQRLVTHSDGIYEYKCEGMGVGITFSNIQSSVSASFNDNLLLRTRHRVVIIRLL
jgi:hypothetical protein